MLDVVLVVVLAAYCLAGLRQGFVVGVLSVVGFVAGAVAGMALLPRLVADWQPGLQRTVGVVLGVLAIAWVAQVGGVVVGRRLRDVVDWHPARVLDSVLGAVAALAAVALVTWFVAGAVRGGPLPAASRAVASSRVVAVVDQVVPPQAEGLFSGFRSIVEAQDFPRVFAGVGREPIVPVAPPDPAAAGQAAAAAAGGIVKVTGVAEACQRGREGTGFVVADERVLTNAHVVAGVDDPVVRVGGEGPELAADVVVYDPERDLAVLAVPDLTAEPLPRGVELGAAADAVVAGFPLDGPYTSVPARVREVLEARGQDIYGTREVRREVYSLAAHVEPGNSGGPLLDPAGRVTGVVFARSLDDPATGYALTLDEAAPVLDQVSASSPVGTGACTAG